MKFCYNTSFTLPKQPKNLDLFCKVDLDFWDCFGREKNLSRNRRNRVIMSKKKIQIITLLKELSDQGLHCFYQSTPTVLFSGQL